MLPRVPACTPPLPPAMRKPPPPSAGQSVRLIDIAAQAGVSATVVSAVLKGHTGGRGTIRVGAAKAQRIRQLAARMNYRPNLLAQALKGERSNVIGVLIGADSTPANYERLGALEREADRRGCRLMIGQFHDDAPRTAEYLQDFRGRGIDMLMCFHNPAPRYDRATLTQFRLFRGVVFQTATSIPNTCVVDVDRAAGVQAAVEHLAQRGRCRIALVLNTTPARDPLMMARWRGYRQGLQAVGLAFDPALVWTGDGRFPPVPECVQQAVTQLTRTSVNSGGGGMDAVVASNDVWAMALLKVLRRTGFRVPGDVAVVGFDNLLAASLFDPALTTIDPNHPAFAAAAVDLLLKLRAQEKLSPRQKRIIVPPLLVTRETS